MTALHWDALVQLAVDVVVAVVVGGLYVWTGNLMASLAGFALFALTLYRYTLPMLRRERGRASRMRDERDEAIQRRATGAAHTALWLGLVLWAVAVMVRFHARGAVPLVWVAPVVFVALWLVTSVKSITVLVLDHRGS